MEIWIPFNGTEVFARVPDERFMESVRLPEANPLNFNKLVDKALKSAEWLKETREKKGRYSCQA